jgi:two-component system, NarL family, response regulator YdfI
VLRVLIGATSEAVRVELASLVTTEPALRVVGSFSIETAFNQLEELHPDVVLLDLESSADESMPFTVESTGMQVSPALVILTNNPEDLSPVGALRSGTRAILPREAKVDQIFAAIQASMAGLVVLHPDILDLVLPPTGGRRQPVLDASDQILTSREIEVLRMIAQGLGNKEIASKLGISDHTVKFHTSSIFTKLGASNRAEAVSLGIRDGLIMV